MRDVCCFVCFVLGRFVFFLFGDGFDVFVLSLFCAVLIVFRFLYTPKKSVCSLLIFILMLIWACVVGHVSCLYVFFM